MAQRILKNNTANIVAIPDTGYSVPASGQLVIPPQVYGLFEGSSDVIGLISYPLPTPTLTVNDGTFDLGINEGVRLIQGGFSRPISDGDDPTVKAKVTSLTPSSYYDKRIWTEGVLAGLDILGAYRRIGSVVRPDGITALPIDGQVEVRSTFGYDQQPDSYFKIIDTGLEGDSWTIYIAGTSNDPSTPDRDLPAYSKTFYVLADEVGDEIKLRDRMVQELNADTVFKSTVYLKAQKATDRSIVHIQSLKFSANGEFYERPNINDFSVTVTGSAVRVVGFDNLISRSKPVTISRDLDSPHRLGLFGVTGTVSITFKELSDLFFQEAKYLGSSDMKVVGSLATPIPFTIPAQTNTDIYIQTLIFHGQANGIKFGQFLAKNIKLPNGLLVQIKSDNVITDFPVIKATEDFKNDWAALSGNGANFRIDIQAGLDEILAILQFDNPFVIRSAGTFTTDDYITVFVRDDLTSGLSELNFQAKGFEKEP